MSQSYVFMKKHKTSSNKSCWFQFYVPCFHGLCAPAHICWGRGICLSGRRWMSLRSFVCIGAALIFFYLFMSVPGNNVMWSPSLLVTAIQRVIVMVTLTKQWRWWQSWCHLFNPSIFTVLVKRTFLCSARTERTIQKKRNKSPIQTCVWNVIST